MRIIKLNTKNRTFSLRTVKNQFSLSSPKHVVKLNQVGKRGLKGDKGDPGDPASNLVTSVNGKQGVVVLNSSDVGADASGAAAQALNDAKAYTDQEVGDIDTGVLSVTAGTNVTVDNTDPANPIISSSGGGASDWGDLGGTITDQADLVSYVAAQIEESDMFKNFKTNDIEKDGLIRYIGQSKPNGDEWLLMKMDKTTDTEITYANVSNNSQTTYADAWTDRATLTYEDIGKVVI